MTDDKLMDGLEKRKGAGEKGVTSDRPAATVDEPFGEGPIGRAKRRTAILAIFYLSFVMVAPAGNAWRDSERCQLGRPWYTPRFVCQKRIMSISRVCLFTRLLAFAPVAFAQEASPSPSAPT